MSDSRYPRFRKKKTWQSIINYGIFFTSITNSHRLVFALPLITFYVSCFVFTLLLCGSLFLANYPFKLWTARYKIKMSLKTKLTDPSGHNKSRFSSIEASNYVVRINGPTRTILTSLFSFYDSSSKESML